MNEKEVDIAQKLHEGFIRAVIIIEVLGKPAEHVRKTLKTVVEILEDEKNLEVLGRKLYKPKKVKGSEELFVSFMEVEILAKGLTKLFELCFDYMPSSVEIIEPKEVKFDLSNVNAVINDLASRLHQYDSVAKKLSMENQILKAKLSQVKPVRDPVIRTRNVDTEKKQEKETQIQDSENKNEK